MTDHNEVPEAKKPFAWFWYSTRNSMSFPVWSLGMLRPTNAPDHAIALYTQPPTEPIRAEDAQVEPLPYAFITEVTAGSEEPPLRELRIKVKTLADLHAWHAAVIVLVRDRNGPLPAIAAPSAEDAPHVEPGGEREKLAKLIAGLLDIDADPSPQQVTADIVADPFEVAEAILSAILPDSGAKKPFGYITSDGYNRFMEYPLGSAKAVDTPLVNHKPKDGIPLYASPLRSSRDAVLEEAAKDSPTDLLDSHMIDDRDAASGRMTWPWWMRGHQTTAFHGGYDSVPYFVSFEDRNGVKRRANVSDTIGLERDGNLRLLGPAEASQS